MTAAPTLRDRLERVRRAVEVMRYTFQAQQKWPELRTDTEKTDDATFHDAYRRADETLAELLAALDPRS